jgi:hypothetical protein
MNVMPNYRLELMFVDGSHGILPKQHLKTVLLLGFAVSILRLMHSTKK